MITVLAFFTHGSFKGYNHQPRVSCSHLLHDLLLCLRSLINNLLWALGLSAPVAGIMFDSGTVAIVCKSSQVSPPPWNKQKNLGSFFVFVFFPPNSFPCLSTSRQVLWGLSQPVPRLFISESRVSLIVLFLICFFITEFYLSNGFTHFQELFNSFFSGLRRRPFSVVCIWFAMKKGPCLSMLLVFVSCDGFSIINAVVLTFAVPVSLSLSFPLSLLLPLSLCLSVSLSRMHAHTHTNTHTSCLNFCLSFDRPLYGLLFGAALGFLYGLFCIFPWVCGRLFGLYLFWRPFGSVINRFCLHGWKVWCHLSCDWLCNQSIQPIRGEQRGESHELPQRPHIEDIVI